MKARTALITGVSGQDGAHLAQLLLSNGYKIAGTSRNPAAVAQDVDPAIEMFDWDLKETARFTEILDSVAPSEVYNLAAMASGSGMYEDAVEIGEINGLAVARILEAIRMVDADIRFCQASSSELFGEPEESPQSETTRFHPRSPYGAAKLYAHEMVGIYRKRHGLFACSGILFNHESERRGPEFVTGKVTEAAAAIKLGLTHELVLGNLDARRDWGFSGDFARGMWMMLQTDRADDFVLATGQGHSVRELCDVAFSHIGLDYRDYVVTGREEFRADERVSPLGDASKAKRELGWEPKTGFIQLVHGMVDAAFHRLRQENELQG